MKISSAQGTDFSSYQPRIDAAALQKAGNSFAFAKATNGMSPQDPLFAGDWAAILSAGVHRGAYHELTPGDGAAQARHFMSTVTGQGLRPGDMLACVASDYPVSGSQAKAFLDTCRAMAGPRCPVLLYSDLDRLLSLADCARYPLWLAAWRSSAPQSVTPWDKWTFWQYASGGGVNGGDMDAFNGTAAQLDAWIASYADSGTEIFGKVRSLALDGTAEESVTLSWESPGTPMPFAVAAYEIAVCKGAALGPVLPGYPRYAPKGSGSAVTWTGDGLPHCTQMTAAVRAVAIGGKHAGPWAEVTFTTR